MIELLRRVAADDPGRIAVVSDTGTTSYGELAATAQACAAGLRSRGISRFAIQDDDAAAVIALLAAASLAGVEACQYPPAATPDDVAELAARFDHDVVVTPGPAPGPLTAITFAQLAASGGEAPEEPPTDRPHLVLTTGTTGAPRGVRHDWNRILRAAHRIAPTPGQRWLLAYGPHQFAGLQILVHVMAAGATLVVPAHPRPRNGLDAMRTHGVTHASATPTYWRFLLAELRADGGATPTLTQVTLGGEAIPAPLLDEIAAAFPGTPVSQVYAASEFGSSGSIKDGRNGLSLDVLERGDDADIAMKIVDGELWVRSRVGMLGYYGDEPVDPDGWRPTGDLVEIVDERILFRGRTSEVINVGGVKVHPLPIEDRIGAVEGVDMARVYGRPNPLTGAVVAVEIVAAPAVDHTVVEAAVRAACADLPAASRPRSITFVDTVSMAGNKIVRRTQ